MEKIPTIYDRDWEGDRSRVLNVINPNADVQWVFDGEGVCTRKYDGTCVMFDGEKWWARREVKEGKSAPAGFVPVSHDHITLAATGWQPIAQSPFAKFHVEALKNLIEANMGSSQALYLIGTYELCGPKINKNPEGYAEHVLIAHVNAERYSVPRTFEGIRDLLDELDVEGFVFHHDDGHKMAKIKSRDYGLRRG